MGGVCCVCGCLQFLTNWAGSSQAEQAYCLHYQTDLLSGTTDKWNGMNHNGHHQLIRLLIRRRSGKFQTLSPAKYFFFFFMDVLNLLLDLFFSE